jgi:hypothetical protein
MDPKRVRTEGEYKACSKRFETNEGEVASKALEEHDYHHHKRGETPR